MWKGCVGLCLHPRGIGGYFAHDISMKKRPRVKAGASVSVGPWAGFR
jgi:hypothetical protein